MSLPNDALDIERFKEVLHQGEYLSSEDIAAAEIKEKENGISFADALLSGGYLTKELLGQCVAESFGLRYVDIDSLPTERTASNRLSEEFAKANRVVLVAETESSIVVASDRPVIGSLQEALSLLFPDREIEVRYTLPENLEAGLQLYEKPLSLQFAELFSTDTKASVPDVINQVIDRAVDLSVSDIHFEPQGDSVTVRFRMDGALIEAARLPRAFFENVLNRIKVLARLPIDEHMRTQDGSFRRAHTQGEINIRVSIAPTIEGEKIALRLLASYASSFTLESLGLSPQDYSILMKAAGKPFGMVLVTGPTGSGKTTTLYAFLKVLNTSTVNITTIEDPVEYKVNGVNQMQVNSTTDLTFARGLRSIVRQDPDIVLVGEIRDTETAEIAVNAALTGHLLFSTFHSNDAATTIPRLIDMGVEPFLLASTLDLVVAQRLVRKICDSCRTTYSLTKDTIETSLPRIAHYFKGQDHVTLYRGKGCSSCHMTGYRGRLGTFELIQSTPEMQDLIIERPSRAELWKLARAQGSRTLFDDGFNKVLEGVTTIEELLRAAEPEEHAA